MGPTTAAASPQKRGTTTTLAICIFLVCLFPALVQADHQATLVMGSWRTDDIRQMNIILDQFHAAHPEIRIIFDPTPAPDYDEALAAQLAGGTAPDLFYLRSFGVSRRLYEQGYLEPLDGLASLHRNFSKEMTAPWSSASGKVYGVPFIATSHGVYYNQDLFSAQKLQPPATWEEFLATCQQLATAGILPLANTSGDPWTILEIVFFNLAPNFIGGREGRLAYLNGERCFNDSRMVSALSAVADLAPYMPKNHNLLSYGDSLQLFLNGQAAMWLGGSWDIPYFNSQHPPFSWSIFAPPPPQGKSPHLTFHLDAGIGLNARSRHKEAAMKFLDWISSPAFGQLLGDALPGFFPMHNSHPLLADPQANVLLALNQGRQTDVRLAWENLREGSPDGYQLMLEAANGVLAGTLTAQEAADHIQNGLAQWYSPAQHCQPAP